MKTKSLITAVLLAAGSVCALKAQETAYNNTPASTDVWLAVSGIGQGALVDIGTGGSFAAVQSTLAAFNMNSINPDLDATFGAGWTANANVRYSIFSVASTGYFISGDANNSNAFIESLNAPAQATFANDIQNLANEYYNNNETVGLYQTYTVSPAPGDPFQISSLITDASAFSTFSGEIQTTNSGVLNVYDAQNSGGVTQVGQVDAVPEPSTYALIGFGALLLVVAYRRKAAQS